VDPSVRADSGAAPGPDDERQRVAPGAARLRAWRPDVRIRQVLFDGGAPTWLRDGALSAAAL